MNAPAAVEAEPTAADVLAALHELDAYLIRLCGALVGAVA